MIGGTHEINYDERPLSDRKGTRDYRYRLYTFVVIALVQIFLNYDVGVVPVILSIIKEPYKFTSTELGIMGGLPYIGAVLVSPFMSYVLVKFNSQIAISIGIVCNILSLCLFSFSFNKYMFYASEFLIGATRAIFFVYYPLWVDTFAPERNVNLWMSILQGGIVVGLTCGYISTSIFSYAGDRGWRYSLITQAIFELVFVVFFWFLPKDYVNFDPSRDGRMGNEVCSCDKTQNSYLLSETDVSRRNTVAGAYYRKLSLNYDKYLLKHNSLCMVLTKSSSLAFRNSARITRLFSNFEHSMKEKAETSHCDKCFLSKDDVYQETMQAKNLSPITVFKLLAKQKIFVLCCVTMSILLFKCTGVQYWMTTIGMTHYHIGNKAIHLIFSIVNISGPLLGVLTGSYLIDQIIFHYPQYPLMVDFTLIIWASIACFTGIIVSVFRNPMTFSVCLFIILVYGSSLVPTLTLTSVCYLPQYLKPAGASLFICTYNIFGLMMGTLLPGLMSDLFKTNVAAIYTIFFSGFFGLASYSLILLVKWKRIKSRREKQ